MTIELSKVAVQNAEFLDNLVTLESLKPKDGKTFCNIGLNLYAKEFGISIFEGKLANQVIELCSKDADFSEEKDLKKVMAHVNSGGFAFAGKTEHPHGHIAAIYPGNTGFSGSWNCPVPIVANIGKKNGLMKASEAFSVATGKPLYFLFSGGKA